MLFDKEVASKTACGQSDETMSNQNNAFCLTFTHRMSFNIPTVFFISE